MLVAYHDQVDLDPTSTACNLSHRIPSYHFATHGQPGIGQLAHACVQNRLAAGTTELPTTRVATGIAPSAAKRWLEERQAELLPVDYYHVVFTLPAPISAIAYYNKAVIYRLLFEVAAETLSTIAADPKHLGAQIGTTLVLHTGVRR